MSQHPRHGASGTDVPADPDADRLAADRVAKLAVLRERGIDPYPVGVEVTDRIADLLVAWAERLEPGEESSTVVSVGGRLVAKRGHGRLAFLVLRDGADELQALCALDALGEDGMALVGLLDTGDWVAARGPVVRSKRGELSVGAREVVLVGKSLRAMPDKWHGLSDVEQRYRQREVDLAVNADSRRVFEIRAATLRALRAEYADRGFVEVETPVLQTIPGGANARPFATHHHALDAELYLRIALELHLKRLVAGGLPRVFEIGRVFRNEGLSTRHNPEFTMLESYEAFADYRDVMELTEALVQRAAVEATGGLVVTHRGSDGSEEQVDLGGRWPRRTVVELVAEALDRDVDLDTPVDELRALCDAHGVAWRQPWGAGRLIEELRDQLVEPTLRAPTFVLDYPVEVSPLARRHRDDPRLTERFELIVAGRELANAFSELTDPAEQRARFELQAQARAAGDDEAMLVDEPFLRAMEFGMPPMGGLGVGIDRLVMLLAGVPTIRDVVLFPTLRPER